MITNNDAKKAFNVFPFSQLFNSDKMTHLSVPRVKSFSSIVNQSHTLFALRPCSQIETRTHSLQKKLTVMMYANKEESGFLCC